MSKDNTISFADMADVCEYSHNLTIEICNRLGLIAEYETKTKYTKEGSTYEIIDSD